MKNCFLELNYLTKTDQALKRERRQNMKRWILAEMVMVAAIFFLGWVIKIQLNPVAQAKETTAAEIYVQTEKGLIPYSQVKIVPIGPVKAVLKKEPVVDQPVKTSNQQLLVQVYEQSA